MSELKVEGYEHLVKDDQTSSFINTNTSEFIKAKRRKQQILEQKKSHEQLEQRVNDIEDKLNQILILLQKES